MITSMLPGFRDLRTPLAAGYVWLASLWFIVADALLTKQQATGVMKNVATAADSLGKPAWAAALSFVAYLIGSMFQVTNISLGSFDRSSYFRGQMNRRRVGLLRGIRPLGSGILAVFLRLFDAFGFLDTFQIRRDLFAATAVWCRQRLADLDERHLLVREAVAKALADSEISPMERNLAVRRDLANANDWLTPAADVLALQILTESEQVAARLNVENKNLFDDYDRIRSEAELRFTISLPILVLGAVLASLWEPVALAVAVITSGLLFLQGLRRQMRADAVLYQALMLGYTASPTMSRIEGLLQK